MPAKLPITYLTFLTTKGHYGCKTLYRSSLDHLDRQVPLSSFGLLYAHIKITEGDEAIAEVLKSDLESRGFVVETATVKGWSRGMSHFEGYLSDQVKVSKDHRIYANPYILWSDDDSPMVSHRDDLLKVLYRMSSMLDGDPELLTSRFLRREDRDPSIEVGPPEGDLFYSRHLNFQPLMLRARDYHRACKGIEDNWGVALQMHIEALWREIMAPMSRSERKHAVWLPDYAETVHLGVPQYVDLCKQLSLNVYPNP